MRVKTLEIEIDPKHWIQSELMAFDNKGEPCYCALGSVIKALGVEDEFMKGETYPYRVAKNMLYHKDHQLEDIKGYFEELLWFADDEFMNLDNFGYAITEWNDEQENTLFENLDEMEVSPEEFINRLNRIITKFPKLNYHFFQKEGK